MNKAVFLSPKLVTMRILKCYISDEAILSFLGTILICFYSTVLVYGLRESITQESPSGSFSMPSTEQLDQHLFWPVPDQLQLYEVE